jgi:hypothetical protein
VSGHFDTVATVTPDDVAKVKESYTGRYLRELLVRRAGGAQEKGSMGAGKLKAAE